MSNGLINYSMEVKSNLINVLLKTVYYGLPNLEALNFRKEALYNANIDLMLLLQGLLTLSFWIILFLFASNIIFYYSKFK